MCGGASTRMKRDKAWLNIAGIPLWQFQLQKLRSFAPEILISVRPGNLDISSPECQIVPDVTSGLGPLGGLISVLDRASFDRVIVLAVDMPGMTADYLTTTVQGATSTCGLVPMWQGFYQGLAAAYPKKIIPVVQEVLASDDHSLQHLNRLAIKRHLMRPKIVTSAEEGLFRNWNYLADISLSRCLTSPIKRKI